MPLRIKFDTTTIGVIATYNGVPYVCLNTKGATAPTTFTQNGATITGVNLRDVEFSGNSEVTLSTSKYNGIGDDQGNWYGLLLTEDEQLHDFSIKQGTSVVMIRVNGEAYMRIANLSGSYTNAFEDFNGNPITPLFNDTVTYDYDTSVVVDLTEAIVGTNGMFAKVVGGRPKSRCGC